MAAPAGVLQVVDDTLKKLAEQGLDDVPMAPRPDVTIGPLDRDMEGPRLNWFLYQVNPNRAYRNMEYPRTGTTTGRGSPPLALELHYLLTAYPAELTTTGDQQQTAHVALAAAMRKLHDNAIVGDGSPFLPAGAPPLVEPLRFALEALDLETLSKIWTSASQPMRLSVGYVVSLAALDSLNVHQPGPPVREPRVVVVPSLGPRLREVTPARFGADTEVLVRLTGAIAGATAYTLAAEPGDPAPATDWAMTVVRPDAEGVVLRLPRHDLVPGARRLDATTTAEGLPAGRDSIGVTVVPTVVSAGAVTAGAPATLTTAHCTPDVELFFDGREEPVAAATATSVTFDVPAGSAGRRTVTLRANKVAGPTFEVVVS